MTLVEPARMCREDGSQLPLVAVESRAAATGLVLDTTFRQHYRNDGDANIEAVYTFPLPQGAVLLGLAFTLGERRLVGVVSDRRKAEQLYEQALDEGHSAVLLEKSAEGLYTVSLGNLMAGEEAVVELRYAQLLSFVDGAVRIAIPTVVAPRYGSALAAGLPHHAIPEADLLADYPARFTIELGGELAGGIIACPSHPAQVQRHPGRRHGEPGGLPRPRLRRHRGRTAGQAPGQRRPRRRRLGGAGLLPATHACEARARSRSAGEAAGRLLRLHGRRQHRAGAARRRQAAGAAGRPRPGGSLPLRQHRAALPRDGAGHPRAPRTLPALGPRAAG